MHSGVRWILGFRSLPGFADAHAIGTGIHAKARQVKNALRWTAPADRRGAAS